MKTLSTQNLVALVLAALVWPTPAPAAEWFDLGQYQDLKRSDRPTLEFVLVAMYETVFYAQGSIGTPVICASPIPIPAPRLIELMDREIDKPTNPIRPDYTDNDHVAFVFMNALKTEGACK